MAETTQVSHRQSKEFVVVNNALITPSVSPPPSAVGRAKSSSRPPPKRPRINSLNSAGPSSRASSSSSKPIDPSRDEAWRASSKRLIDVWDSLAERYNVPLDQDDIIDLRTVELVKDRGIVRSLKKGFDIGVFGAPEHEEGDAGASSEDGAFTEVDERDEEVDEIDSFAQEPVVPVKIELEKANRHVPPFRAGNPDDANDLKEFLEAEERRRARDGEDEDEGSDGFELLEIFSTSEEEDTEGDSFYSAMGSRYKRVSSVHSSPIISQPIPVFQRIITDDPLTAADEDTSEDEFAAWSDDAASARPPSRTYSDEGPSEHRPLAPPSPRLPPSVIPSKPSVVLSRRPKSVQPSKRLPSPTSIHSRSRNIQLQTPPLSHTASSVSTETPEVMSSPARPTPYTSRPSSFSRSQSPLIASSSRTSLPPQPASKRTKTPSVPGHVVEVLIPPRLVGKSLSIKPAQRQNGQSEKGPARNAAAAAETSRSGPLLREVAHGKGKAKDIHQELSLRDISDDELPPPPKFKPAPKLPFDDISDTELPSPGKRTPAPRSPVQRTTTKPPRRKRKRSSTSSTALQTSPDQSPIAPSQTWRTPSEPARGKARHTSEEQEHTTSDESEAEPIVRPRGHQRTVSSRSRSSVRSSDRSSMPPPPVPYPPMFPSYPPSQRHLPPPPLPPIQDPQAQYGFMQAVQYLSYYLAGTASQAPPPPDHYNYPQAWPQTPKHRSRAHTRDPSSSPPRTSSPGVPSGYPTSGHRYSHSYDVGYSSGTSPPMSSSPIPSSPTTTYHHPTPAMPQRSKSSGRRVSFKLDSDDETHPRYARRDDPAPIRSTSEKKGSHKTPQSSSHRTSQRPHSNLRHAPVDGHTSEEDSSSWRRGERGRTPGPSSRAASRSGSTR
ncbi:hypothetical protein BC629DRAFT_1591549 [Irpex lacteus]|nr:hypothetical protein BC629DRAFT_1591549 [Irpex lacteus]